MWILTSERFRDAHTNVWLLETARRRGISVQLISQEDVSLVVASGSSASVSLMGEPVALPGCALARYASTSRYQGRALMHFLESRGVPVINSASANERACDKFRSLDVLADHVPIPRSLLVLLPVDLELVERSFDYPVVVKELFGSEGRGVHLCRGRRQLSELSRQLQEDGRHESVLIQSFIHTSEGRHVRVLVIGEEACPPLVFTAQSGHWKSNAAYGASVSPLRAPEAGELALKAARRLGLTMAGVDLLFGDEGYLVCEVNPAPTIGPDVRRCLGEGVAHRIFDVSSELSQRDRSTSSGGASKAFCSGTEVVDRHRRGQS